MILYLTTRRSSNTLRYLFRDWARGFRWRMRRVTYEALLEKGQVPRATLLFTDHERMDAPLLEQVCSLWDQAAPHCVTVNDPSKVLSRYDLLKLLYEKGINRHRCLRLDELPDDLRFPVFVRGEFDHSGPVTDLIADPAALKAALASLSHRTDLLVIEFEDTSDEQGRFRKFSSFRLGDAIVPKHIVLGSNWITKTHKKGLTHARLEEIAYSRDNPHETELRRIFDLAGIDYGRIDYGMKDGKPVVWEINTNPTVMSDWWRMAGWRRPLQREFTRRYVDGLLALGETPKGPPFSLSVP